VIKHWPTAAAMAAGSYIAGSTPMGGGKVGFPVLVVLFDSDLFIKLLFAGMWCSFGLLHLRRINEITSYEGMTPHDLVFDRKVGFAVGLLGSMWVASITGVGVDIMIYMVLVLWCHADLKIAIPTSVVLMAFTSLVGIATKAALGDV
jgi:uncharacterized membrane protein YfcA